MTGPNVPPEAIGAAPPEPLGQTPGPVGADPFSRDPDLVAKMGWVGRCFGHVDYQKGNLVGVALIFSALMVAILVVASLVVVDPARQATIDAMFTPLVALLSGVFGYLTGNNGR